MKTCWTIILAQKSQLTWLDFPFHNYKKLVEQPIPSLSVGTTYMCMYTYLLTLNLPCFTYMENRQFFISTFSFQFLDFDGKIAFHGPNYDPNHRKLEKRCVKSVHVFMN
jgi:hypothetical protein